MNPKIPARMKQTVPWTKVVLVLRNPVDRLYSQYKMIVRDVFDLRHYSVEDFLSYELTAMKEKFRMTTAPLPTRTAPNSATAATTTTANNNNHDSNTYSNYTIPESVPFDHPRPVKQWRPKQEMAILKKPDAGRLRNHNCVRRGLYSVQLEWWLEHYTLHKDLVVINYDDLLSDTESVYKRVLEFVGIPLPTNLALDGMDFEQRVRADHRRDDRPLSEETRNYMAEFYAPYNARLESLLGPEWSADKLQWK